MFSFFCGSFVFIFSAFPFFIFFHFFIFPFFFFSFRVSFFSFLSLSPGSRLPLPKTSLFPTQIDFFKQDSGGREGREGKSPSTIARTSTFLLLACVETPQFDLCDSCTCLPSPPSPYCCSPSLMGESDKRCNSGQQN